MKLHDLAETYIGYERALGLRFRTETKELRSFCRAMGDITTEEVRPEVVLAFIAGRGPVTARWVQKYRVLGRFYRYALGRGFVSTSPLPSQVPKLPPPLTPYIYSVDDLRRLLIATDSLWTPQSPLQPATMHTLLLLLYGTGMRISEALSLTLQDADLAEGILTIRNAKFFKERLIPIGPRLVKAMVDYAVRRRQLPLPVGDASTFFATSTGHRLHYEWIGKQFRRVRAVAGICRESSARYQPRIHDIRHTAAVHRIIAWYRAGADVQQLLPQLATYLGHVDVSSTQRYLDVTAELLHEASLRFEHYAQPEVRHA